MKISITPRLHLTFFAAKLALSLAWLACLAWPCAALWNRAIVPACRLQPIGFRQALGMLLLCYLVRLAARGVQLGEKGCEEN